MTRWQYFRHMSANMSPSMLRWTWAALFCSLIPFGVAFVNYGVFDDEIREPIRTLYGPLLFFSICLACVVMMLYFYYMAQRSRNESSEQGTKRS
jgi:hypothetical protein